MLAGSIGLISNAAMRLIIGPLADRFGFKTCYFVVMTIQIIISVMIVPTRSNGFLYSLFVVLSFMCEGANLSMFPAVTGKIFGAKMGGQLFPFMFLGIILTSESLVFVKTYLITGNSGTIFYVGGVLSGINIVLLCFFKEPENKSETTEIVPKE